MRRKGHDHNAPTPEYYSPDDAMIDRFAKEVSERMATERNEPGFLDYDVMWGLADFIKLIARLTAKQLSVVSDGGGVDDQDNQDYPMVT